MSFYRKRLEVLLTLLSVNITVQQITLIVFLRKTFVRMEVAVSPDQFPDCNVSRQIQRLCILLHDPADQFLPVICLHIANPPVRRHVGEIEEHVILVGNI